jgi:hypothetical protein
MGTQYFCSSRRRLRVAEDHITINGIRYLEVLDQEAIPLNSPRQRTLLVRCIKEVPAGLNAENVIITGGVRITPVQVEWARRASEAGALAEAGLINPEEEVYFSNLDEPEQVLLVRTNLAGDYSTYRLRLALSPTSDEPPADFDPILSEVSFSFTVECPSDFDCAPGQDCPPDQFEQPVINYLAKDYASFRRVLLDRLSVIIPDWRERSPADMYLTLVELLAYRADYLSYYQDAVATEAYLGTAHHRTSLRRHARLLDYPMHEGCNARTWVCIEVDPGGDGQVIHARHPLTGAPARLSTRLSGESVLSSTEFERLRERQSPVIFELMHDLVLYSAHNEMRLYTWGDEACCLPKGATQAVLLDDPADRLRLRPGDVVIFEEQIDPATGRRENADPSHRHPVRLTRVQPEAIQNGDGTRSPGPLLNDELLGESIVEIEWDAADRLPFAVCVSERLDDILITDISTVRGNVVLADHGFTRSDEHLPLPQNGFRRYRPHLQEKQVTYRARYSHNQARTQPAAVMLQQSSQQALPEVILAGGGETWTPQFDLLGSDRFATEFAAEVDDDGRLTLRFGDGVYGRQPDRSTELVATYRVGSGSAGNLGAESLRHLVGEVSDVIRVRNPLPAVGGVPPETNAEVRQYAPQAFRTQERAVTAADYAAVVQRHPQVQKAVAARRWTGSWYTMFITIDRRGGLPVTPEFEDELVRFLERFRLAGHDVEINGPRPAPLEIVMTVCVKPGYFRSQVKQDLLHLFSSHNLPSGRRGFFHPDNFTFGQPLYLSQVIAAAMDVPGVKWVDLNDKPGSLHRFQRWGKAAAAEIKLGQIKAGRTEILLLDNDPSQPENGKIDFIMEGGL